MLNFIKDFLGLNIRDELAYIKAMTTQSGQYTTRPLPKSGATMVSGGGVQHKYHALNDTRTGRNNTAMQAIRAIN